MAHDCCQHKLASTQISSAFLYSHYSSTIPQIELPMQSFETTSSNVFNQMEMLGSPWKNLQQQRDRNPISWRGFISKPSNQAAAGSSSSSKSAMPDTSTNFYHPDFQKADFSGGGFSEPQNENLIIAPETSWQENRLLVDDSSLRCVLPSSQGLSLSLCHNKPSNMGLQSSQQNPNHHGYMGSFSSSSSDSFQQFQQIKNSKYLAPAQELLKEFCNLGTKQNRNSSGGSKHKSSKNSRIEEEVTNQSLYSLDLLELQKKKAKLISMLEEVDRRYRQYCDQMRVIVASFEAVAGVGAASVYASMASKAMSRHFRWLRDGIVGQIQAIKKAMGEKDLVAPGTTRGETPRLKLLDQSLRQQKAFQQMGMMENHPWRPQRGLPDRSVSVLRAWLFEHFLHPYPSDVDKHILARQTGLSRGQVSNWFINARVRLWKPMVEEMYLEETKEGDNRVQDTSRPDTQNSIQNLSLNPNPNLNNSQPRQENQKPTADQLFHDSESLSSIFNSDPDKRNAKAGKGLCHQEQHRQFDRTENIGLVDLDFSSYCHAASTVTYTNSDCAPQNFSGANHGGVSLTLGLQQHGGSGVNLSFSRVSQNSLLLSRQHMEECQPIQYSILDGEAQNLPYRNLMGAQLLHDLAG